MLKNLFKQVPGFRTGSRWKMGIAVIGYLVALALLFTISGVTTGDKVISFSKNFIMLAVPYILVTNVSGLRNKLPLFKRRKLLFNVIGVIAAIFLTFTCTGVLAEFESPAFKEMQRLAQEQREKENEQKRLAQAAEKQRQLALKQAEAEAAKAVEDQKKAEENGNVQQVAIVSTPAPQPTVSPTAAPQQENSYLVIDVVDGDTIKIDYHGNIETVRLIGVDTPETVHPSKPVEPYGKEASNFTKSQLEGKYVRLEFDVEQRDHYGRLLAYVYVGNEMFNRTLLKEGYGQLMTIAPNVKYVDSFKGLQQEARESNKGLWAIHPGEQTGNNSSPANTPKPASNNTGSKPTTTPGKPSSGSNSSRTPVEGVWIKGNINSKGEKIYHVPGGAFYSKTNAEEWFKTEAEAKAAGYRRSKR